MKLDLWSLGLQTVNVLVLVWLLHRFLFKPVLKVVAERQAATTRRLEDAAAARAAAEAARNTLESEPAELASSRDKLLAEARVAAHAERDALLDRAAAEAARRSEEAQAALQRQQREAQGELAAQAAELAVTIARRLLGRLPHERLLEVFLDDTCHVLAGLPEEQRRVLLEHDVHEPLQIVTADALSADIQQRCRERLTAALGTSLQIGFAVDAQLLAGVELRFRHIAVRNSWSNDLDRVLDTLKKQPQDAAVTA
jgi:F-type H+-transporting ATPase subunit b